MTSNFKFHKTLPVALVALSAALLPAVYAQTTTATPGKDAVHEGKTHSMPMSGAGMGMKDMKDMKGMMKDNNDKMSSLPMSGNADVDFAMMMRVHHQGAIDMAQAELKDGKAPEMRKLAQNIIAAQKKEIAQLDKFLAKNGHRADKHTK